MLVMTFRTVTFISACSGARAARSAPSTSRGRRALLEPRQGGNPASCSRRRWTRRTANARATANARVHGRHRRGRPVIGESEHLVGDTVGGLTRLTLEYDPFREAAKVLHEHDAQRDRHGPQLADRERRHVLVGAHEATECVRVEAAVGERDVGPGHAVDAREAGELGLGQLRQRAVVAGREVLADLTDLLVDDVEVVDEPLGGGRDPAFLADRLAHLAQAREQDPAVLGDAPREAPAPPPSHVAVREGEVASLLLELGGRRRLRTDGVQEARRQPWSRRGVGPPRVRNVSMRVSTRSSSAGCTARGTTVYDARTASRSPPHPGRLHGQGQSGLEVARFTDSGSRRSRRTRRKLHQAREVKGESCGTTRERGEVPRRAGRMLMRFRDREVGRAR